MVYKLFKKQRVEKKVVFLDHKNIQNKKFELII
jgi:hypothetical protein